MRPRTLAARQAIIKRISRTNQARLKVFGPSAGILRPIGRDSRDRNRMEDSHDPPTFEPPFAHGSIDFDLSSRARARRLLRRGHALARRAPRRTSDRLLVGGRGVVMVAHVRASPSSMPPAPTVRAAGRGDEAAGRSAIAALSRAPASASLNVFTASPATERRIAITPEHRGIPMSRFIAFLYGARGLSRLLRHLSLRHRLRHRPGGAEDHRHRHGRAADRSARSSICC